MNTDTPAWLDIIPPRHAADTHRRLASEAGPGDPLTVTAEETRKLNMIMGDLSHFPNLADDLRQQACRILGPQRVAIVLQNIERGLGTPVTVES